MGFAITMTGAAQDKIIKIGTVFPLTGPCAVAGLRAQSAVETMAEIINNKHAEINIPLAKNKSFLAGYKIVLVKADFQGQPDVAKSETERLYNQEGCYAVIGCYNSSASKPASAVAERLQKIFVCGASSSAALTERGLKYFFRCAPTDRTEAQEFVQFFQSTILKKQPGALKSVGIIYENSEFGKHAADEAKKACASAGISVVADVPFTPGATNLNSEVQTLKSKNPDAIFGACLGGDYT
ncbi:MAG TPA: ABC transporter substrate-binding protein, partial [Holophaga sp.]|nr:ABC transporter substrate-binding protein [Holophaga sp.]